MVFIVSFQFNLAYFPCSLCHSFKIVIHTFYKMVFRQRRQIIKNGYWNQYIPIEKLIKFSPIIHCHKPNYYNDFKHHYKRLLSLLWEGGESDREIVRGCKVVIVVLDYNCNNVAISDLTRHNNLDTDTQTTTLHHWCIIFKSWKILEYHYT